MSHLRSEHLITSAPALRTRRSDNAVVAAYIHEISRPSRATTRGSVRPIRLRPAVRRREHALDRVA